MSLIFIIGKYLRMHVCTWYYSGTVIIISTAVNVLLVSSYTLGHVFCSTIARSGACYMYKK